MSRFLYPLIALSFLLLSCQKDIEERPSEPSSNGSVGFNVSMLQTRGTPLMQLSEVPYFRVIAYRYQGTWGEVNAQSPATLLLNHVQVTQGTDGSWTYSPLAYWPNNESLTFFAYAPGAGTDGIPNTSGLSISTPTDGTAPVITYTVPTTVENQPDLLVCTTRNYDLSTPTSGQNGVNISLAHALTCVSFKATGHGERVSSVKVSGVVGSGSITLGSTTPSWDINPTDTTYTFEAGSNQEVLDQNPSNILNEDGHLMMIPQRLGDHARLTIVVDGGNSSYEQTFKLQIPGNEEWQPGQFIQYEFAVSPTSSILILPEHILLPYHEEAYSSFSIVCPEESPDATWTVSAPDGGWLQLSDSPTGENILFQSSPYIYSGKGSKLLYAFSPTANPLQVERNTIITLDGTSQQVNVKQLFQDQVYIPEYPHDGWAGSNIYWVPDQSYPNGGYLTFDDKEVTTHETYQGVYFMWGSLVALSPMGTAWTGGMWYTGNGQILYVPNQNPATNGGWSPNLNSGWGYIPRLGWTNSANPNGGGSAISIPYNDGQSYLIQNHDPVKNLGDICKYITDMGWAPGVREGRKWRMPTHIEYLQMADYAKENPPFSYQASNDPTGQMRYTRGFRRYAGDGTPFFPLSGYRINYRLAPDGSVDVVTGQRPGEAFSYWTSSPRNTNGDAFDYININSGPTNTQGFSRDSGSAIRCVLENNK